MVGETDARLSGNVGQGYEDGQIAQILRETDIQKLDFRFGSIVDSLDGSIDGHELWTMIENGNYANPIAVALHKRILELEALQKPES